MNEAREKGEGADKEVLGEVEVEKKGVKRDLERERVWLMELLKRMMEVRLGRRQRREAENGPERLKLERSSAVTVVLLGPQVTPAQLQGVASRLFQEEREESGSSRDCFHSYRYKPSWFSPEIKDACSRRRRRKTGSSCSIVSVFRNRKNSLGLVALQ